MERMEVSQSLILLHSERPKLYTILAFLSVIGLKQCQISPLALLIESLISLNSNNKTKVHAY